MRSFLLVLVVLLYSHAAHAIDVAKIQIESFAQTPLVVTAIKDFSASFGTVRQNNGLLSIDDIKEKLKNYYDQKFISQFNKLNTGKQVSVEETFQKLDDDAVALQYYYFVANDVPKSSESDVVSKDSSQWTLFNDKYHPTFKKYLEYFGLNDIYLVDASSGNIIYSTNKKIDFSTNLRSGPFASSALGKTFQILCESSERDVAVESDIQNFVPSFNEPARFVGTPVYEGDNRVGILIFQLPIGM